MSRPNDRIVSGPVDPDLDAALAELVWTARRIRQVEDQILTGDGVDAYHNRVRMLNERADKWEQLTSRAEKLALPGDKPGRTLMLMIEEADRLFARHRRRPTLKQVMEAVAAALAVAEREKGETAADLIAARLTDARAGQRVTAAKGAMTYLEACCADADR